MGSLRLLCMRMNIGEMLGNIMIYKLAKSRVLSMSLAPA